MDEWSYKLFHKVNLTCVLNGVVTLCWSGQQMCSNANFEECDCSRNFSAVLNRGCLSRAEKCACAQSMILCVQQGELRLLLSFS